jgi:hypothetical protein
MSALMFRLKLKSVNIFMSILIFSGNGGCRDVLIRQPAIQVKYCLENGPSIVVSVPATGVGVFA